MENMLIDDKIRKKIVSNRKKMGYKQEYVVIQMQLAGLDISYQIYRNIECGRRRLNISEFLFLVTFLNIDISQMSHKLFAC